MPVRETDTALQREGCRLRRRSHSHSVGRVREKMPHGRVLGKWGGHAQGLGFGGGVRGRLGWRRTCKPASLSY